MKIRRKLRIHNHLEGNQLVVPTTFDITTFMEMAQ